MTGLKQTVVALVVAVVVALVCAVLAWTLRPRRCEGFGDRPTIFVSVASYRDSDCANTLRSLFENASDPSRVHVGVCEQNSRAGGEACVPPEFEWHDQVRRIGLPSKEAKGPTFARYLCSTLYNGETFYCQVDSHTRFTKGWDTRAISMLRKCPSSKPVLTHYPHDWSMEGRKFSGSQSVPVLCRADFDDRGVPTFNAVTLPASSTPKPVPFTSGGFVFGPGTMLRDVPFDPDLPHLFQGEEVLYSARLWTSGYDFFTPTENLVFHHYYRDDAPKFWSDVDYAAQQERTVSKVRKLLEGKLTAYSHGMGTARTLREYWDFAGIDWATRTTTSALKFCK